MPMNDYPEATSGPITVNPRASEPIVLRQTLPEAYYEDNDANLFDESQRKLIAGVIAAILKHKWLIAGALVVSLIMGLAVTLTTKPLYTAHTTIQIDREASKIVNVESLDPAEATSGAEFMETQIGLLRSEALARRVVQTENLTQDNDMRAMAGLRPVTAGGGTEGIAVENLMTGLVLSKTEVAQQGLSRLVRISFTSPDRKLSARIANAIASNFQAQAIERKFDSSSYARKFLETRIAQVKQKLEESEKQLVDYGAKQQIINVTPPGADNKEDTASQSLVASNLSALNSMMTQAQGDRIRAEQRWRQAENVSALSLPEALSDPTIQALIQKRDDLAATYQQKLKVFKPDLPDMQQLKAQMDEVDKQLKNAGAAIKESIRARYEVALRQEQSLAQQVNVQKSSFIGLRERNIQNTILEREVETNRTLYDGLLQRYKEVGVAGGVDNNNISIVDPARAPGAPSSPNLTRNLALSLFIGSIIAGLMVMLLELLDESVRTPEDVQSKLGLAVLGIIPALGKGVVPGVALANPRSAMSEAYSSTRTSIQFITSEGVPPNLLITSSRSSEGKSTTAVALARSFANLKVQVLLIDADLRNPSVHRLVACSNERGLSNYLTGSDWKALVQPTSHSDLAAMTSGPLPPNPAELLANPRFVQLLQDARSHFDLIIIDGPPVIGLADSPILASRAAATLLVIESGRARRGMVRIASRRLNQARAKIAGAILTKFNAKSSSYGYGYGYGYEQAYSYEYGSAHIEKAKV